MSLEDAIQDLGHFGLEADQEDFQKLWGENLGNHLWWTFSMKQDSDVLRFYRYLDGKNRKIFIDAVNNKKIKKKV